MKRNEDCCAFLINIDEVVKFCLIFINIYYRFIRTIWHDAYIRTDVAENMQRCTNITCGSDME